MGATLAVPAPGIEEDYPQGLMEAELKCIWTERGRYWNSYVYEFLVLQHISDDNFIRQEVVSYDPVPTNIEDAPWLPTGSSPTAGCLQRLLYLWDWFEGFAALYSATLGNAEFVEEFHRCKSQLHIYSQLMLRLESLAHLGCQPTETVAYRSDDRRFPRSVASIFTWSLFRNRNFSGLLRSLVTAVVENSPRLVFRLLKEDKLWDGTLFWSSNERREAVAIIIQTLPPVSAHWTLAAVSTVHRLADPGLLSGLAEPFFHKLLEISAWNGSASSCLDLCSVLITALTNDENSTLPVAAEQMHPANPSCGIAGSPHQASTSTDQAATRTTSPASQYRSLPTPAEKEHRPSLLRKLVYCRILCLQYTILEDKYRSLHDLYPLTNEMMHRGTQPPDALIARPLLTDTLTLYTYMKAPPTERIHLVLSTLAPYYIRVVNWTLPMKVEVDSLLFNNVVWDVLLHPFRTHAPDADASTNPATFYSMIWRPLMQPAPCTEWSAVFTPDAQRPPLQPVQEKPVSSPHGALTRARITPFELQTESYMAQDVALFRYCQMLLLAAGRESFCPLLSSYADALKRYQTVFPAEAAPGSAADFPPRFLSFWSPSNDGPAVDLPEKAPHGSNRSVDAADRTERFPARERRYYCASQFDWLPLVLFFEIVASSSTEVDINHRPVRSSIALGELLLDLLDNHPSFHDLPAHDVAAALDRAAASLPGDAECLDITLLGGAAIASRAKAGLHGPLADTEHLGSPSVSEAHRRWARVLERFRQLTAFLTDIAAVKALFAGLHNATDDLTRRITMKQYRDALDTPQGTLQLVRDIITGISHAEPVAANRGRTLRKLVSLQSSIFRNLSCNAVCAACLQALCDSSQLRVIEGAKDLVAAWEHHPDTSRMPVPFYLDFARCVSQIVRPVLYSMTHLDPKVLAFCRQVLELYPLEHVPVFDALWTENQSTGETRSAVGVAEKNLQKAVEDVRTLTLLATVCLDICRITQCHTSSTSRTDPQLLRPLLFKVDAATRRLLEKDCLWELANSSVERTRATSSCLLSTTSIAHLLFYCRQPLALVGVLLYQYPSLADPSSWPEVEQLLLKLEVNAQDDLEAKASLTLLQVVSLLRTGNVPDALLCFLSLSASLSSAEGFSDHKNANAPPHLEAPRLYHRRNGFSRGFSSVLDPQLHEHIERVRWILMDVACRFQNRFLDTTSSTLDPSDRVSYIWKVNQHVRTLLADHDASLLYRSDDDYTSSASATAQNDDNDAADGSHAPPVERHAAHSARITSVLTSMMRIEQRLWVLRSEMLPGASSFWTAHTPSPQQLAAQRQVWELYRQQCTEQQALPSHLAAEAARKTFKVLTFAASSMFPASHEKPVEATDMLAGLKEPGSRYARPLSSTTLSDHANHQHQPHTVPWERNGTIDQQSLPPLSFSSDDAHQDNASDISSLPMVDDWGDSHLDVVISPEVIMPSAENREAAQLQNKNQHLPERFTPALEHSTTNLSARPTSSSPQLLVSTELTTLPRSSAVSHDSKSEKSEHFPDFSPYQRDSYKTTLSSTAERPLPDNCSAFVGPNYADANPVSVTSTCSANRPSPRRVPEFIASPAPSPDHHSLKGWDEDDLTLLQADDHTPPPCPQDGFQSCLDRLCESPQAPQNAPTLTHHLKQAWLRFKAGDTDRVSVADVAPSPNPPTQTPSQPASTPVYQTSSSITASVLNVPAARLKPHPDAPAMSHAAATEDLVDIGWNDDLMSLECDASLLQVTDVVTETVPIASDSPVLLSGWGDDDQLDISDVDSNDALFTPTVRSRPPGPL